MVYVIGYQCCNLSVVEYNLLGFDVGFGLLYGSGGDVVLYLGCIDVVVVDGVIVDKLFVVSE